MDDGRAAIDTPVRRPAVSSRVVALVPPAVALVLGAVILTRGTGLWYDELFSTEVARLPLSEILRAAWEGRGTTWYLRDVPPSYNLPWYVVAHVVLLVPGTDGDLTLRLVALLAGAAASGVLAAAVSRLAGDRRVGLVAGLVTALNPLVLEWSVEARSYGLALLATAGTAYGLARWLDRARWGLLVFGLCAAGAGLAHWYALLPVAGLTVAGIVLAPRRGVWLALVAVVAAAPTLGLVALNLATVADRNAALLHDTAGRLPLFAAWRWSGQDVALAGLVTIAAALGVWRAPTRLLVVVTGWLALPVLALLIAETELRAIYEPRYVLPALLGLGVLTAAGVACWPWRGRTRRWGPAPVLSAVLLAVSLVVSVGLLWAPPRERSDEVAAMIAAAHRPGDVVMAGDRQSALALEHYVRTRHPQMAADLRVPPIDAAPDAAVVWYVRVRIIHGETGPVDGDVLLANAGRRVEGQWFLRATWTSLVVQRWVR
ncbi:glycosyltransferase family 39 protein [Actinomycetospora flava]|uniref:Glycosyltransferase family 39 protein n=1 Tax=Actinomycetospora flava TaxID=3129232 RepID=A0ABU8MBP6_9PSEU